VAVDLTHEIEAAVDWWASRLANIDTIKDTGHPAVDSMLSISAALAYEPVTGDQLDAFRAALRREFEAAASDETARYPDRPIVDQIRTDYGPQGRLRDACLAAGLVARQYDSLLPYKTSMVIVPGRVTVSEGYGAPDRVIYPT
jgi:hypothetical protein